VRIEIEELQAASQTKDTARNPVISLRRSPSRQPHLWGLARGFSRGMQDSSIKGQRNKRRYQEVVVLSRPDWRSSTNAKMLAVVPISPPGAAGRSSGLNASPMTAV